MNDPDEAHRMTQERIAKLEKDKEQAERVAVESRKNEENAKKLAEEERRKRLEAEAEVRQLRARLGLQRHG
jgi:membrane protein involved in colicin uptake